MKITVSDIKEHPVISVISVIALLFVIVVVVVAPNIPVITANITLIVNYFSQNGQGSEPVSVDSVTPQIQESQTNLTSKDEVSPAVRTVHSRAGQSEEGNGRTQLESSDKDQKGDGMPTEEHSEQIAEPPNSSDIWDEKGMGLEIIDADTRKPLKPENVKRYDGGVIEVLVPKGISIIVSGNAKKIVTDMGNLTTQSQREGAIGGPNERSFEPGQTIRFSGGDIEPSIMIYPK
jgi:hypothetical protein